LWKYHFLLILRKLPDSLNEVIEMKITTMREKLVDEISQIPDEKVPEIFDFIHHFRLGLNVKESNPQNILKLAGSWNDMSEADFTEFQNELKSRRKNAFTSRRNK
jgi:hypothetical protein